MGRKLLSVLLFTALVSGSLSAQIFYKIEGNGLSKPSYIFGTHHLAPLSIIDSIEGCRTAFNEVEQVVGEIDMTGDQMSLAMKMQPYMMAPQDSTLTKVISAEDLARINEEFKKWSPVPGMDLSMLEMMRPMVITSMVSVEMVKRQLPNFNPQEQLDIYFQAEGKNMGKSIIGLETPEFQAKLLYTSEPISTQAKTLIELLDDPSKNLEKSKELNDAYLAQNIKKLYELTQDEDEEESAFMEALVNRRNENWIQIIPGLIKDKSSFIAVGALHLPGDTGVVEGLRKAGYTVTPIE